jgi:hypothetical protein
MPIELGHRQGEEERRYANFRLQGCLIVVWHSGITTAQIFNKTIPANPERKHTRGVRTRNPIRLASVSVEESLAWDEEELAGRSAFDRKKEGVQRDRARKTAADAKRFSLRGYKGERSAPRAKNATDQDDHYHRVPERVLKPEEFRVKAARKIRMSTATEVHSKWRNAPSVQAQLSKRPKQPWLKKNVQKPSRTHTSKPIEVKKLKVGMISRTIKAWKLTGQLPNLTLEEIQGWDYQELTAANKKRLLSLGLLMEKAGISRQIIEALLIRGGVELHPGPICPNSGKVCEGEMLKNKRTCLCPLCPAVLYSVKKKINIKNKTTVYFGTHPVVTESFLDELPEIPLTRAEEKESYYHDSKVQDKAIPVASVSTARPAASTEIERAQDDLIDKVNVQNGHLQSLMEDIIEGSIYPQAESTEPAENNISEPPPCGPKAGSRDPPKEKIIEPPRQLNIPLDGHHLTGAQCRSAYLRALGHSTTGLTGICAKLASFLLPIGSRERLIHFPLDVKNRAIDRRLVTDRNVEETEQDMSVVDITGPKYPFLNLALSGLRLVAPVIGAIASYYAPTWAKPAMCMFTLTSTFAAAVGTRLFNCKQNHVVTYAPHMVSSLVREYNFVSNDEEAILSSISNKARRLATLPLADTDNLSIAIGSQLASVAVLTDQSFFEDAAVCGPATPIPQAAMFMQSVPGLPKYLWQSRVRNCLNRVLPTSAYRRCVITGGFFIGAFLLALPPALHLFAWTLIALKLLNAGLRSVFSLTSQLLCKVASMDSSSLFSLTSKISLEWKSFLSTSGSSLVQATMNFASHNFAKLTNLFTAVSHHAGSVSM